MKTLKELYVMLYKYGKDCSYTYGLCYNANRLLEYNLISYGEFIMLSNDITSKLREFDDEQFYPYVLRPGVKDVRQRFLKTIINSLGEQNVV